MKLIKYLKNRGDQHRLAKAIGATDVDVHYWKTGKASIPVHRCVAIEKATGGKVTRKDLRDDWRDIWPELENQE